MLPQRIVVLCAFFLAGCSATEFSAKETVLSSKSVFGDKQNEDEYSGQVRQGNEANGGIRSPGSTGDTSGGIRSPGSAGDTNGGVRSPGSTDTSGGVPSGGFRLPDFGGSVPSWGASDPGNGIQSPPSTSGNTGNTVKQQPDRTNDEVDIRFVCSDNKSMYATNYKRAISENRPIEVLVGSSTCTKDVNEIKAIVQKKSFTIADAKRLCPALVPEAGQWTSVTLKIDGSSYTTDDGEIEILYALNRDRTPADQAGDSLCDERSSPLVIHMASDVNNPRAVELSSQEDGVDYDLLGSTNNYQSVRISWFTNHDYRLLALPAADGKVHGIDDLFGNATLGPDGKVADNGYAALAKYDGTTADGYFRLAQPDGRIDRRDPIYGRLRLWLDRNFDGISQADELVSLRAARIAYIDLDYSTNYAETDQYGNKTMMKSVVGYMDGTLDLIFDLWFAYNK